MGLVHDTVELNDDTVLLHSVTTQCCCVELNDDTVLVSCGWTDGGHDGHFCYLLLANVEK